MAIAFANIGTIHTTPGPLAPGMPTGTLAGDLLVLFVAVNGSGVVSTPSGWQAGPGSGEGSLGSTSGNCYYFWRVSPSDAPAAPAVLSLGLTTVRCFIARFTGTASSGGWSVSGGTSGWNDGADWSIDTAQTVQWQANDFLFGLTTIAHDDPSSWPPERLRPSSGTYTMSANDVDDTQDQVPAVAGTSGSGASVIYTRAYFNTIISGSGTTPLHHSGTPSSRRGYDVLVRVRELGSTSNDGVTAPSESAAITGIGSTGDETLQVTEQSSTTVSAPGQDTSSDPVEGHALSSLHSTPTDAVAGAVESSVLLSSHSFDDVVAAQTESTTLNVADLKNDAIVGPTEDASIVVSQGQDDVIEEPDYSLSIGNADEYDPSTYSTRDAKYRIYVDWYVEKGLAVSDFETSLDSWEAKGTTPPDISLSSERWYSGVASMLVEWQTYNPFRFDTAGSGFGAGKFGVHEFSNPETPFRFDTVGSGFDDGRLAYAEMDDPEVGQPHVAITVDGLTVGREYDLSAWVWVPQGSRAVRLEVVGRTATDYSLGYDQWLELAASFEATETSHEIRLAPLGYPAFGELVWMDQVRLLGPGVDISHHVLGERTALSLKYGRDDARSLSDLQTGEVDIQVNNIDRRYSPNNQGSPLYGFIKSGRPVLIEATFGGQNHILFKGYIDDFEVTPDPNDWSVSISAIDQLGRMAQQTISTEVVPAMRTGEVVHRILDEINWPKHARVIDPGGTTVRWWSEHATDALDALNKIVRSEGPPAYAYLSTSGDFVFRDRHHRLTSGTSINSQATLRDKGLEPNYSAPVTYDLGWKDVINTIEMSIEERNPGPVAEVWKSEDPISLQQNETRTINVEANSAFIDALDPVLGVYQEVVNTDPAAAEDVGTGEEILVPADADYIMASGKVQITLKRRSGQSVQMDIRAIDGSAVVKEIRLRAKPIDTTSQVVSVKDTTSIASYGERAMDQGDMPWATVNDAAAVAEVILGQRSENLPTFTLTVNNGNGIRFHEVLSRDLSDRIRIIEEQTFTDAPYYIEQIEQSIESLGKNHTAVFGCEQARDQVEGVFMFDDEEFGFDVGLFGYSGISHPEHVFILDQSNLDNGLLGY